MYIFTTELKFEIYVQQRRFGKILFPVLDGGNAERLSKLDEVLSCVEELKRKLASEV